MKNVDVLVIGGSAAGLVAAMTAKLNNPDKEVMLIRKEEKVMIPCGIPYIFGTLGNSDGNILPDGGLIQLGVEINIDTVTDIDTDKKVCRTEGGTDIHFDKLILATGSLPVKPNWLKGSDLNNVFTVPKSKGYLDKLMDCIKEYQNIVVIGAGFIGVELSDEINKAGKNVTLVEILPHILGLAFDEEVALDAEEQLKSRGVNVITGIGIEEIIGADKVEKIKLTNGEIMDTDVVILSMGYRPNAELAQNMGLQLNDKGFIKVDQYMRTSEKDIFAVGDCAEKKRFCNG